MDHSQKNRPVAIKVENIHKTFRIPLEGGMNLKQRIVNISKGKKGYRDFSPLNGVSFEINEGEFFGIVGRNGSGKSTLLKTIAGIYTPDEGYVKVNGTLVPFIELGVGFNPELTGRENVYLNGALLGFSRSEVSEMYKDIVDFAELQEFMDERLKNYSSGMQVRLAFSIAIRAKGDILLLDEVLAVGDSAFQQKCLNYFTQLKREKKTVILVTHGMSAVERFCDRALLLEGGKVVEIGSSVKVAELYENLFLDDANKKVTTKAETKNKDIEKSSNSKIELKVDIYQNKHKVNAVRAKEEFSIKVDILSKINLSGANLGINIRDDQKRIVFSADTRMNIGEMKLEEGQKKQVVISIDNFYTNGNYSIDVHIVNERNSNDKVIIRCSEIKFFQITGLIKHVHSMFHPNYRVELV